MACVLQEEINLGARKKKIELINIAKLIEHNNEKYMQKI